MCHSGADVTTVLYGFGDTTIAAFAVALSNARVSAIAINERYDEDVLIAALTRRFPRAKLTHDPIATRHVVQAVTEFVEHPRANLNLPLDIKGTDFQRRVWDAVMAIPFGETTTFTDIAATIGAPRAIRAVGNACSQNPLEFAIPCHRVLRSDGSNSGGSSWGNRRQQTIIRRERESRP